MAVHVVSISCSIAVIKTKKVRKWQKYNSCLKGIDRLSSLVSCEASLHTLYVYFYHKYLVERDNELRISSPYNSSEERETTDVLCSREKEMSCWPDKVGALVLAW